MQEIRLELTKNPKQKPAPGDPLPFGTIFTDHMFMMDYDLGQGWHDPRIVPYGPIELDPSAMCLHYGQSVFEGMKAYRAVDGRILLFRPEKNMARRGVREGSHREARLHRARLDPERRGDVPVHPPVHHRR